MEPKKNSSILRRFLPFVFVVFLLVTVATPLTTFADDGGNHAGAPTWLDSIRGGGVGGGGLIRLDANDQVVGGPVGVNAFKENLTGGAAFSGWWESLLHGAADLTWKAGGWVMSVSGTLLNLSIDQTVIKMGEYIKGITAIETAWTAFRDLANIALVFILLYIGISTIIKDTGFSTKKLLGQTIVVAIFINFSYLMTTLIIDFANILTLVIDKAIGVDATADGKMGIANGFANAIDIQKINNPLLDLGGKALILAIIMFVVYLIISLVFFFVASLFIARLIILIILIIVSPIAFIASIMDNTRKSVTDKWWNTLLNQAFFAPSIFLFFWISLLMMKDDKFLLNTPDGVGGGGWAGLVSEATFISSVGLIFNLLIVLGILIGGVMMSRKIAGGVSGGAQKIVGGVTKYLGGAAIGTGALAYRQSVARVANNVSNSDWATKRTGFLGKVAVAGAKKVGNTSGDARNTKSFSSISGLLSNESGGKSRMFGEGAKKGYADTLKDKQNKADKKSRDFIESRSDENFKDGKGEVETMIDESGNERPMTYKEKAAESSALGKIAHLTSIDSEKHPILAGLKALIVPDLPGSAAVRSAGKTRKALISDVENTGEKVNELKNKPQASQTLPGEIKLEEDKKADIEKKLLLNEAEDQKDHKVAARRLQLQTALGDTVNTIETLNEKLREATEKIDDEKNDIIKQSTGGKRTQADIMKYRLDSVYNESEKDKKKRERDEIKKEIKKDLENSSGS
jgi:hypothetical protein